MIRCRYDTTASTVDAFPGTNPSSPPRTTGAAFASRSRGGGTGGKDGAFGTSRAPLPSKSRQPYVHEKFIPTERLLDPNDFTPNLDLVFNDHLSEIQQRRLLRRMEREQRLQSDSLGKLEKERKEREEKERLARESKQELSELELLEQKLAKLSSALDKKTTESKTVVEQGDKKSEEEDRAMKEREAKRAKTGKKWALYQAVHLDEDGEELVGPPAGSSDNAADVGASVPTSLAHEKQRSKKEQKIFYGEPSPGRGAASPPPSSSPASSKATTDPTTADNKLSNSKIAPPAPFLKGEEQRKEIMTQSQSPPRFERTAEKRAKMKALFDNVEEEQGIQGRASGPVDPAYNNSVRSTSHLSGVAARANKKKRIIVDL